MVSMTGYGQAANSMPNLMEPKSTPKNTSKERQAAGRCAS